MFSSFITLKKVRPKERKLTFCTGRKSIRTCILLCSCWGGILRIVTQNLMAVLHRRLLMCGKEKKPSEICFMNWKCDGVFNGWYKRLSFSLAVDLSLSLSQYFANLFCLRYRMGSAIKGISFIRIFFPFGGKKVPQM